MKLKKLYKKYNRKYFDNELPKDVKIRYGKTKHGKYKNHAICIHDGDFIAIRIARNILAIDLHETLLHEMIHVWQAYNGQCMDHNGPFYKKARKLKKKFGFNYKIKHI